MRLDTIEVTVPGAYADRRFTGQQLVTLLDAGPSGGGGTSRATMTASYQTLTTSPTVYYTALHSDGSALTSRTASGVGFIGGLYTYTQATIAITDFIAVWDEGDPAVYTAEWIVVDT